MKIEMDRAHFSGFLSLIVMSLLFLVTGCSPIARAEQVTITDMVPFESRQTVGQTLVANYDGLMGVDIFIDPKDAAGAAGELRLHLRTSPGEAQDLAAARLPLSEVKNPGFYRFLFSPIQRSNGQSYYFYLELDGVEKVDLARAPGVEYLDGALYVDHRPADSQLAFQLVYDSVGMVWGLILEITGWLGLLLAAAALFVFPGWVLLAAIWKGWSMHGWMEKLAYAAGVSLSIYPLLMLWTDLVGVHLGAIYAWTPPVVALGYLVWRSRSTLFQMRVPRVSFQSGCFWPDSVLAVLLVVIFVVRFWPVRILEAGLYGDAYHHTTITQLMVDHGGLFRSWLPYAELTTFTYHFAFHAWASVLHWVTAVPIPKSVLWMGQITNALSIVALYPLALRLVRSRWAGALAVLVAGLLMSVPMIYTNWGRYTQLAGQVILPIAICFLWEYLDSDQKSWDLLGLNWLVWPTLGIAHYLILILAVFFLPALLLAGGMLRLNPLRKALWVGLGSGVLFLPWFIRVFGGKIMALFTVVYNQPVKTLSLEDTSGPIILFAHTPSFLWMLVVAALMWELWQRNRAVLVMLFWWALIFFGANPGLLNLPGRDVITNFSVAIAMYIFVGPVVGAALGQWSERLLEYVRFQIARVRWLSNRMVAVHIPEILLASLVVFTGLVGGAARTNDVDMDTYSLLTRPDLRAFQWIEQNTTHDSRFLVNAFLAYYRTVTAGTDGGWWLSLLTERGSSIPPMTTGFEQGIRPDYQKWVNSLVALIEEKGVTSGAVYQELKARQITHIYVGQLHGKDKINGNLLDPEVLLGSPYLQPVYHEDRVWIFEVR